MTAFLPQFTKGEWQVGFSENKYLTKPSFWGVTFNLSIQSIKRNVLHYSLVNVLISNKAELLQLPRRRLNDPAQMSPLLRSFPAPQGRVGSFLLAPTALGAPLLYSTLVLHFVKTWTCPPNPASSPTNTHKPVRWPVGQHRSGGQTFHIQIVVPDYKAGLCVSKSTHKVMFYFIYIYIYRIYMTNTFI